MTAEGRTSKADFARPFVGCSRREMLRRAAGGFGSLALAGTLVEAGGLSGSLQADPLAPKPSHFKAKAKAVIFLYSTGGVSHVDSFDPKPRLFRDHNKSMMVDYFNNKFGQIEVYLKQPNWQFRPGGSCGTEVSDLFPFIRSKMDDICLIRSMSTEHQDHFQATLGMHTGSFSFARPSMGAWVSYGLGTENRNLPSFMVLAPSKAPYAGTQVWGSSFLPAFHQGAHVRPGPTPIANLEPRQEGPGLQHLELDYWHAMNRRHLMRHDADMALEARIRSFETAFGMQSEAPEIFDLAGESDSTLALYGLERGQSVGFAWQCLMGRRLVERGVRFVELIDTSSWPNWDSGHSNMAGHEPLARKIDQPIAALITDLEHRGMLDQTLVVWTTEFGRPPFHSKPNAQGRDHHHLAFSSWLAGGGIKGGIVHGETDDVGRLVTKDRVRVYDLQATILHLLGLDHERLTYRHAGRDFRLTDVYGDPVRSIMA